MDLPEESKAQVAKRKAIQSLMKNKSLTPAEKNKKMQEIMRGNFSVQESDGESSSSYSEEEGDSEGEFSSSSSEEEEEFDRKGTVRRDSSARSATSSATGASDNSNSNSNSINNKKARAEQQKAKQKALLAISRDKSLSAKERARKMKEIMQTSVGSSSFNENDESTSGFPTSSASAAPGRRRGSGSASASTGGGHGGERLNRKTVSKQSRKAMESLCEPDFDDGDIDQTNRQSLVQKNQSKNRELESLMTRIKLNDTSLKQVNLEKRNINDESVIPLFDALISNTHVEELILKGNRIGTEGCSALASTILDNSTIIKIDLSGNNVTDEGIQDLSKVIPYNQSLVELNLSDNKFGDVGVSALAASLIENESIEILSMNGNLIGDDGGSDLFKVLASANSTVVDLGLRMNVISDRGATALASALIDNETLLRVDLGHNKITSKGGKDILKVLACNETLEQLDLVGNTGLDDGLVAQIQQMLEYESSEEEESSSDDGSESESLSVGSEAASISVDESDSDEEEKEHPLISSSYRMSDRPSNSLSESDPESESDEERLIDAPGGEAMLTDMPDENDAALAKRKAIQSVMQDKSLSPVERNKKIQDIMAGKVALPKMTKRPSEKHSRLSSTKEKPAKKVQESESESEEESATVNGETETAGEDAPGGEAMLRDMPDENDTALAKRQLIQKVMQDKSLTAVEKNKKVQDIMAGKVALPKVMPKPEELSRPSSAKAKTEQVQESESESEEESSSASDEGDPSDAPGGEAMLRDMPEESNAALAKRQLIKQVMQDDSLSNIEKNEKVQAIIAGRVELPKVTPKLNTSHSQQSRQDVENDSVSESEDSSSESGGNNEPTGALAMLTDMPDENDTALAKRRAIQGVMQDKSLSPVERNKKIQDIMSGKIQLPPAPAKEAKSSSKKPKSSKKSADDGTKSPDAPKETEPIGGESMLSDMPDESNKTLAQRKAIRAVNQDKNLTPVERNKKIQDIIAGRVALPPVANEGGSAPKSEEIFNTKQPLIASRRARTPPVEEENNKRKPALVTKKETKAIDNVVGADATDKKIRKKRASIDRSRGPVPKETTSRNSQPSASAPKAQTYHRKASAGVQGGIAYEWMQQMMAKHPKSHENFLDILLAHKYRLSLSTPPCQSYFRVVSVVFFSRIGRNERFHVVGTNDEPHSIAGSICAERAALLQLRFIPDLEEITKVIIVTDEADCISPGMLCREFMASHNKMKWHTPIVLGRSVCRNCGLTASGKACGNSIGCFNASENGHFNTVQKNLFVTCSKKDDGEKRSYILPHDFLGTVTNLKELFPYPSLYTRLSADQAVKYGENFQNKLDQKGMGPTSQTNGNALNSRLDSSPQKSSYKQESFDLSMLTDIMGDNAGGEKGGSPSSNTNTPVASPMNNRRATARQSMTGSLKKSIDFMRQIREDHSSSQNDLNSSRMSLMSEASGNNIGGLPRTLRISRRTKPAQRREKLMRLATSASSLDTCPRQLHPINYGAAVLFSDGTVAIASQKTALEYGCTLDAVGQLASTIEKKALEIEEDKPQCRPVLLVQCDQFGIAHAPFAPARAFLTERGYGDCKILIHQERKNRRSSDNAGNDDDTAPPSVENGGKVNSDLKLVEVDASNLAPSPPDISGGLIKKSHGLQIQF